MDHMSIITQVSNPKDEEIQAFNQEKASQSNGSLKKQRSRSIFSTFFCCFRNYNVDPPAANTSSLPPPAEENGSPPKVEVIPVPSVCIAFSSFFGFLRTQQSFRSAPRTRFSII
ncbi:CTD small phosphatase-like protein [Liparis tanakae]|uniref:CTD small phosphatase-like protein n=1 Tax=Liparis tanakae TaxID=230148 RepID=A0A4Z2GLV5_9TELE|nr:CTD small phosphatase-like protein [Liparis tanakae]